MNLPTSWASLVPLPRGRAPTGCQRPDTLVVTEDGILQLGELGNPQGDRWQSLDVSVSTEGLTQIATRFFVNGERPTKRIQCSSGNQLECTAHHQYRVLCNGSYQWCRADQLQRGDKLVVVLNAYQKTTEPVLVPVPKVYRTEQVPCFPTAMSSALARFLGMYWSNGSTHVKGIRIHHNAQKEAWKEARELGIQLFGIIPTIDDNGDKHCISVCFNSSALLRWLFVNNLVKPESTQSKLPVTIRCSSRESLVSFLEGYFWGDGSVNGGARYLDTSSHALALELVTVSRAIGRDAAIQELISGFGSQMFRVRWIRTKRRDETAADTASLKALGLENCTVDTVASIEDGHSLMLDIEVPEGNTYLANGVVSHNTIGILAGTSTGIEPIFAVAYKRRYLREGTKWHYQYVVDSAAQELVKLYGLDPEKVESALDLAEDYERRMKVQADIQAYVDQAISSTINLPKWGSKRNSPDTVKEFAATLAKYAPRLRGFTCYPDGARGGQPLTTVSYKEAVENLGKEFEEAVETHDVCTLTGHGGVCGV